MVGSVGVMGLCGGFSLCDGFREGACVMGSEREGG